MFSTLACKAQNTAILAVLRGFATQQDGVPDGATVQGLAVGAIMLVTDCADGFGASYRQKAQAYWWYFEHFCRNCAANRRRLQWQGI
jgi:hypothetical protein